MKIMTILGTRPEIIRLALIIKKLDELSDHVLVHTGQNYDVNLKDVFFEELGVRAPDHYLDVKGTSAGDLVGRIVEATEAVLVKEKPDRILILGDTNSGLAALPAKRMGIPVLHMEAGNRCYDDRVPEEVNRRIIDHCSDILMPYTERSRANLLREGFFGPRVVVTGNPIYEVVQHYRPKVAESQILDKLGVKEKEFFLVTLHRAENVDQPARFEELVEGLAQVAEEYGQPVLVSTHPRTRARMKHLKVLPPSDQVRFLDPFGFFEFIRLEETARCVLSDSGTVQEECAIFGVPNVTLRDVTERPETLECGSNLLAGANSVRMVQAVKAVLAMPPRWKAPPEYLVENVSDTVIRLCLSYHHHIGRAG